MLDARDIDASVVIDLFHSRVAPLFPKRSHLGWRPFWHLSNDGAWHFFYRERRVGPADFGKPRKPNSRIGLLRRIDRVSVPPEMEFAWALPDTRTRLWRGVIDILRRDSDPDCQLMATNLSDSNSRPPSMTKSLPNSSINGGQGFLASAPARRAVERRAMNLAIAHFAAAGWHVEDVSAISCFDLLCTTGNQRRYVEVKGTTGPGDQIILTHTEVNFAQQNRSEMILVVVSEIQLQRRRSTELAATGGRVRIVDGWAPATADIIPISYICALSPRRVAK